MAGHTVFQTIEQIMGAFLMLLILLDVFLTVLYARMDTGIISPRVAHVVWWVFSVLSKPFGRRRGVILSYCGPVILVMLVLVWALGLAVAAGLIIHPELGTSVRATVGETTTRDFVAAMYAGGSSISIVGANSFTPHTPAFRVIYLFNSLVGICVTSLTLMYLMQVYSALSRRNTLALHVHLSSGQNADAAEMIAGLGPEGKFTIGYPDLSTLAGEMTQAREAHHFYPVLFYFRFRAPFYSVSRFTLVALDAATLIKSALDDKEYGWFKKSGAVEQLWSSSTLLLRTLSRTFVYPNDDELRPEIDEEVRELWRRRYFLALQRLRQAGIRTVDDEARGAQEYVDLRSQWNKGVAAIGPMLAYSEEEVDPVIHRLRTSQTKDSLTPFVRPTKLRYR